jgi:two-component system chemotaxis response regulator CheY
MGINILIVDDSATTRANIQKTIKLSGIAVASVLEAANGAEALKVLGEHWTDIVLTDINMPVMNGVDMIRNMKSAGMLPAIPIIVISTDGSAARAEQLKELGVVTFLQKPIAPENLRDALVNLLGVNHE